VRIQLSVPDRGRDIDCPMAGAVNVGTPPEFERLIGAYLVAEVMLLAKKRTRADSLMRGKISLFVRFNSLQGLKKFPVRMRRELSRKTLS